jgi:hypothetical protein
MYLPWLVAFVLSTSSGCNQMAVVVGSHSCHNVGRCVGSCHFARGLPAHARSLGEELGLVIIPAA